MSAIDAQVRIAFIGAGNMAEAIVSGMLSGKVCVPSQLCMTDVSDDRLQHMQESYGVRTQNENASAVRDADMVLLAVKPQVLPQVLSGPVAESSSRHPCGQHCCRRFHRFDSR